MDILEIICSNSPYQFVYAVKPECLAARYKAEFLEDIEYDFGLPQNILNDIKDKTGIYSTSFVYAYHKNGEEGFLPLDNAAEQLLSIYFYLTGNNLVLSGYKNGEK